NGSRRSSSPDGGRAAGSRKTSGPMPNARSRLCASSWRTRGSADGCRGGKRMRQDGSPGIPALLVSLILAASAPLFGSGPAHDITARDSLTGVPMPFVENQGQADRGVAFSATTLFGSVFVTRDGKLVYALPDRLDAGRASDRGGRRAHSLV